MSAAAAPPPKRFDVVGDVAILQNMPEGDAKRREAVGRAIMAKNRAIKVRISTVRGLRPLRGQLRLPIPRPRFIRRVT